FVGRLERVEPLAHHHVAGGAGAGLLAGMLDVDAIAQRGVQHRLAGLRLDDGAFGAMVGVGQENDLRHLGQSSISFSRRPASAALTVESSRRAAKASVIWLR